MDTIIAIKVTLTPGQKLRKSPKRWRKFKKYFKMLFGTFDEFDERREYAETIYDEIVSDLELVRKQLDI